MKFAFHKKIYSSIIAGFLAFTFVLAPVALTLEAERTIRVNKVEAQEVVYDPTNWIANWGTYIQSALSAVADEASAVSLGSIVTKEYILDSIVWPLINLVIQEMIRSTTAWVRSGFKGSPAFVTDLQGFLLDVADRAAGAYIWGSDLNFLCSPFSLNIRLALDIQYRATKRVAQCRLSSVVNNIDGFFNGNFMNGGWDGFYNVALIPSNNPYGAMYESRGGLYASISGRRNEQLRLLDFGNGFLSITDDNGNIITPGNVVQEQLNHQLGLPGDRLVVADEINELVGALFSQIAQQALSGAGGLLGLNQPYQYQGNTYDSYYGAMAAQNATVVAGTQSGNPTIESSLQIERQYLASQSRIVNLITDASLYKDRVYGNTNQCSGDLTGSLQSQLGSAQQQVQTSNSVINVLTVFLSDYSALQNVNTPQASLNAILLKYGASTVPNAQNAIMTQYLQYQSSGVLHTATDFIRIDQTVIPALQNEIQSFMNSINEDCADDNDNDSD